MIGSKGVVILGLLQKRSDKLEYVTAQTCLGNEGLLRGKQKNSRPIGAASSPFTRRRHEMEAGLMWHVFESEDLIALSDLEKICRRFILHWIAARSSCTITMFGI